MTEAVRTPHADAEHGKFVRRLTIFGAAVATSLFAWAGALVGMKGSIGVLAIVVFTTLMIVTPRRHETLLAIGVLSFSALMHKSFTGLEEISSGPPSVYVSTFDIVVAMLYFAWFVTGPTEMLTDLRSAFRKPIMYVPLVGGFLMAPGLLVAMNTRLAGAEVIRMAVMYAVFVYFAVRIKTRVEVWVVVGGLMVVAVVEAVIVAGQYVTRSSLGLSLFGTPNILHNRFDGVAVARPFGTMAHPVFMGAVLGPLALIAFCLAINIRERKQRWLFLAISAVAVSPLVLASARSASLAIFIAFVALIVVVLITGRLGGATAGWWTLGAVSAAVVTSPYLLSFWNRSFKTEHFATEWESRAELNRLAIAMIEDRPFFGHGLNNFEQVMDRYDKFGLIFADNPVHNMYLLQLAETGIVGFIGMLVFAVAIFSWALRLARVRDRLYSAVGFGIAASFVFWGVEEMLVFSLRQDHPRSLLFILSGLVVSTSRLAGADQPKLHPRRVLSTDGPGGTNRPHHPRSSSRRRPRRVVDRRPLPTAPHVASSPTGRPRRATRLRAVNALPFLVLALTGGGVAVVVAPQADTVTRGVVVDECGKSRPVTASLSVVDAEAALDGVAPSGLRSSRNGQSPFTSSALDAQVALAVPPAGEPSDVERLEPTAPAPVDPEPVDPTPVDPDPVDPEPVDPTPVDPEPVDPAPVDPAPVDPAPVDPDPVDPAPVDPTTTSTTAPPVRGDDSVVVLRADTVPGGATVHEKDLAMVFVATDRTTGRRGIYTTTACSDEIVDVTPDPDADHSWAVWANGGTKIVYTARTGPPGSVEPVYWMNADGSGAEVLLDVGRRMGQPKMSPDGRTIVFTTLTPGTVITRLGAWNLADGSLVDLSAATGGELDSDPRFTPGGKSLVFIDSQNAAEKSIKPGDVTLIDIDGRNRRAVDVNGLYDTDPDVSPQAKVVSSRYLGEGNPLDSQNSANPFQVELEDFVLIQRDLATGAEKMLTNGEPCFRLTPTIACLPVEGSSYLPRHTPDGDRVGYVSLLNSSTTCICTIGADGTDSRALVRSADLAISWFDWVVPTAAPPTAILDPVRPDLVAPVAPVTPAAPVAPEPEPAGFEGLEDLLATYVGADGPGLRTTTRNDTTPTVIALPGGVEPEQASWNADRDLIVFTDEVDPSQFAENATPPSPSGSSRSVAFTLDELDATARPGAATDDASKQLFTVRTDGSGLRRLTSPWTEDWRSGHRDGDAHANETPDLSPDGRYVLYTSLSTATSDSAIMRYDLRTDEVLSLTNATAGAIPTRDRDPSWSTSGALVAFVSDSGGTDDVWLMNADGSGARSITADDAVERYPTWSSDDSHIAYLSVSNDGSTSTVIRNLNDGSTRTVSAGSGTLGVRASFSPDGKYLALLHVSADDLLEIAYISVADGSVDTVVASYDANETWIDWG